MSLIARADDLLARQISIRVLSHTLVNRLLKNTIPCSDVCRMSRNFTMMSTFASCIRQFATAESRDFQQPVKMPPRHTRGL